MVRHGYWAVHTVCGSGTTTKGIDVSKWQTTVDWAKVAADGVKFGVARTSDGMNYDDAYFTKNWQGMKANGIIRGAYQFFRPDQNAVNQAKFMISKINKAGGLKPGDLPPVLDLEKNGGLSTSAVVKQVDKWIAYIQQNTGRRPIIYTGSYFWDANAATTKYNTYPLWTAHYTTKSCPLVPNAWNKWTIWQYTDKGKVSGVIGSCDMNRFNGSLADVKKLAANSVINPPKPDQGVPKQDVYKPPKPDVYKPPKPDLHKPPPKKDMKVPPKKDMKAPPKKDQGKPPKKKDSRPPVPKPKLDGGVGQSMNTLSGGCSVPGSSRDALPGAFLLALLLLSRRRSL